MTSSAAVTPTCSIIIPAYNEEKLLPETITRLLQTMRDVSPDPFDVIVVDNDSTDHTAEVAAGLGATVVHEPHRHIARARNTGAAASDSDILIFVDADTWVNRPLLEETLRLMRTGTCCGGGARLAFDRDVGTAVAAAVCVWHGLSGWFRWAAGSYVFCERRAFCEVGGFNETYYAGEEIFLSRALCKWGKRNNRQFVIVDEAVVTSARKFDWFSGAGIAREVIKLLLNPFRLRRRNACQFWYERPADADPPPPSDH